jgi:predicted ATPase
MGELTGRLASARLVTLVGPGGVGKTRLAIETADRLADELPDGVWLVELAGVSDPSGLLPAVTAALGAGDTLTGTGRQAPTRAEDLVQALAGRAPLLILDNCEHLVAAVAQLSEALLGALGDLRILATSREALGVPGEHLQPVGPLEPADAAELLADRAAAVPGTYDPGDPVTAELGRQLCERLDRLPLAIELAAARLRALPLPQLTERLDNRFRLLTGGARTALPRQQTLRAVVDWSYDLLFDDERRLFQRLAVFVGGCRLDAAEAVCADADVPADDVLDLIGRLVDKSLVEVRPEPDGQVRYLQLQTLWQYGREKLLASGEAAEVRRRHADWYAALCDGCSDRLRGPDGPATRQLIRAELENVRSALDWSVEGGRAEQALRIVNGIAWYWFLQYDPRAAQRWFTDALAASGPAPPVAHALARSWRSYYGAITDGPHPHLADGQAALEDVRATGHPVAIATTSLMYASTLNRVGRYADAIDLLADIRPALAARRQRFGLAMHDTVLSTALARSGRLDEAVEVAQRSIEQYRQIGDAWTPVEPLGTLAAISAARGDLDGAERAYDQLVHSSRSSELPGYLTYWLLCRANIRALRGDDPGSVTDFGEALQWSNSAVNTAIASVGRDRAAGVFDQLGRPEGVAVALAGAALCRLDAGDPAAVDLATEAVATHPEPGSSATVAAVDADAARCALISWVERHLPSLPGEPVAALAPDARRLLPRSEAEPTPEAATTA